MRKVGAWRWIPNRGQITGAARTTAFDLAAVILTPIDRPVGDLNIDCRVGIADLLLLFSAWGPCPDPPADCPADLNGDGTVGVADLLILFANWG